jgi:large subunit ribosomal protein L22
MADKMFRALHRYARISARKARPVADLVRGRTVNSALEELGFCHRRASSMLTKVIRSAMANAGQDLDVDVNRLYVRDVRVDEGPTLKRWRPRAQGRVYPILKRSSHISVVLAEAEEESGGRREGRPRGGSSEEAKE